MEKLLLCKGTLTSSSVSSTWIYSIFKTFTDFLINLQPSIVFKILGWSWVYSHYQMLNRNKKATDLLLVPKNSSFDILKASFVIVWCSNYEISSKFVRYWTDVVLCLIMGDVFYLEYPVYWYLLILPFLKVHKNRE